jgi:beta-barrel assembly-enhancing protease
MAMPLRLPHLDKKATRWKHLRRLPARTAAVLLAGLLLIPLARAQGGSELLAGQHSRTLPPAPAPPAPKTRSSKRLSQYDINRIGHRGIGEGANEYSLAEERQLGAELAAELEMTTKLIADPAITEFADRLGQTIVRNSDARVPFTIKVFDSDEVNAIAVPGGYLYVGSGMIVASDSEAELAALMAHEVAHVDARHATRAETRMKGFVALSMALMFFGGPAAEALQASASVAGPIALMKFGRDAEREADLLGMEYAYAAGYDPQAFFQLCERLRSRESHKHILVASELASHLMSEDRIRRAQEEIATLLPAKPTYIVDTSEFQEVKARLAESIHEHAASEGGRPVLHRRIWRDNDPADN